MLSSLFACYNITQKCLTHLEEDEFEALWVWLRSKCLSCIIAAVLYIPPCSSAAAKPDTIITHYLDRCLSNIERNYQHAAVVILGDTNRYKSETICIRHGLKQVVAGATRKASQPGSVFTNITSRYEPPVRLPPVGTSDHQTLQAHSVHHSPKMHI